MPVLDSPQNVLNAVDYFKAKLQFEQTPHGLDAIKNLPSLLILDVRDREAYSREHIPGAINIPLDELNDRIHELPREKTIVCYCWTITCALATKAALDLAHHGFKVQELIGGIDRWKVTGFKVEPERSTKTMPQQPPA